MANLDEYRKREAAHFDKLANETGEIWWGSTTPAGRLRKQRRAQLMADIIRQYENAKVLEIGCGTGAFTKYILEELPHLDLVGCDISPACINLANERYGQQYTNVKFEVGDASDLGFDKEFDVVLGASILHHLPLDSSLRQIFKALKPGGKVCFSEPNMVNPQVWLEKNVRFIGKMLQNTEDETAFVRWSISRKMKGMGFKNVCAMPFDFLHPVIPSSMISIVNPLGLLLERLPITKEFSGSLFITAERPGA